MAYRCAIAPPSPQWNLNQIRLILRKLLREELNGSRTQHMELLITAGLSPYSSVLAQCLEDVMSIIFWHSQFLCRSPFNYHCSSLLQIPSCPYSPNCLPPFSGQERHLAIQSQRVLTGRSGIDRSIIISLAREQPFSCMYNCSSIPKRLSFSD